MTFGSQKRDSYGVELGLAVSGVDRHVPTLRAHHLGKGLSTTTTAACARDWYRCRDTLEFRSTRPMTTTFCSMSGRAPIWAASGHRIHQRQCDCRQERWQLSGGDLGVRMPSVSRRLLQRKRRIARLIFSRVALAQDEPRDAGFRGALRTRRHRPAADIPAEHAPPTPSATERRRNAARDRWLARPVCSLVGGEQERHRIGILSGHRRRDVSGHMRHAPPHRAGAARCADSRDS